MYSQPIFLRTYRTRSQQLDQQFFRPVNPYDKEEGKLHFLHQKPLCIVILGHPCTGKTTLASKLCRKWKLQLINATEIIKEHINNNTETGRSLNDVLLSGAALSDEAVFNLIDTKLQSPECAHYGYVLDDLPTYGEAQLTAEQQLQYILSLKLQPDCLIKIQTPPEDLTYRRNGLRIDPENGELYTRRSYEPDRQIPDEPVEAKPPPPSEKPVNATEVLTTLETEDVDMEAMGEEGEEEQEPGHPDFPKINEKVKERLLVRFEDLPEMMHADNKYYKERVSQHVKYLLARHNPLKIIELDGNQTPTELFHNLMIRLQAMNYYPSVAPVRFASEASEEEEELPESMDTEELFRTLATRKMPGPRARWQRSAWQRFCPVSLYQGYLALGKPEFAVGFLGNIFCMHSIENFTAFMANPRPYLLPPQPRPPFRVMVVGPAASGKSTVIRLLAERYGARVLDLVGMLQEEHDAVLAKRLADVEAETEAAVIAEVRERHEQELLVLRSNKMITDATDGVTATVAGEIEREAVDLAAEEIYEQQEDDSTEAPTDLESGSSAESQEEEAPEPLPPILRKTSSLYIPKHLREPVDKDHHEVRVRVREALNRAKQIPVELDVDLYVNAVRAAVEEAEEQLRLENPGGPVRGNWIVDGMPMRTAVWKNFIENAPELLPDLVVAMVDSSDQSEFLLQRWYKLSREGLTATKSVTSEESTDKEVTENIEAAEENIVENPSEKDLSPPPGRQRDAALTRLKEDMKQWTQSANLLRSTTTQYGIPIDTLDVDIVNKMFEQLRDEIMDHLHKPFQVQPIPVNQAELEEQEDEDAAAFEEEDEVNAIDAFGEGEEGEEEQEEAREEEAVGEGEGGGEAEEEVDPSRNLNKMLGLTSHFCPVALHDYGIVKAGNPDIAVIQDGLVYYFSSEEARIKFMEAPEKILCDVEHPIRIPPPRILLLGPNGSGKSLHGRQLASSLGLFYVNVDCLLQEVVIPKVGRKLGKEYEDEQPVPDIVLPPLEQNETPTAGVPENVPPVTTDAVAVIEKADLTDHERNVIQYLTNGTSLPESTLHWLLGKYWTQEPYKSTGFILEGYPVSAEQLRFLVDANYFPDLVIVLNTETDEVIGRMLPNRLDLWRKKTAKKTANAVALKDWKTKKKELAKERRRAELIEELQAKRANLRAGRGLASAEATEEDEELDDEVDIDEILAKDQEDEEDESHDEEAETEADAIERLTEEIREQCEESVENLAEVMEQLEEISIPKFQIEAGGRVTWVRYRLVKRINAFIENRRSMFQRVYPVTPRIAERLIANGHRFPSRFGRWCPVSLLNQRVRLPPLCVPPVRVPNGKFIPVLPGVPGETFPVTKPSTCAALFRDNVYWFMNTTARSLFMRNPLKYTQGTPDPPITMPLRIAIVGAPKTGKTSIAKRLAQEYNVPVISITETVRWFLRDPSHAFTALADRLRAHLQHGSAIPDSILAIIIQTLTRNSVYFTRGFILDGYPITAEQGRLMSLHNVRPSLMLELLATTQEEREELMRRGMNDAADATAQARKALESEGKLTEDDELQDDTGAPSTAAPQTTVSRTEEGFQRPIPQPNLAKELAVKLQAFDHAAKHRRDWIREHQGILVDLHAVQNRWKLWRQVLVITKHRMQHLQLYMANVLSGKAASIAELGIEEGRFKDRAGEFMHYCPVSLKERGELEDTINEPKHDLAVIVSVEQTLEPRFDLHTELNRQKSEVQLKLLAEQETDPNCIWSICIPTTLKFAAEYHGRYYRMAGPTELAKFLANPEQYVPPIATNLVLSDEKLPVRLQTDSIELSRDAFPTQVALRGYCPVCFVKSKQRYDGLHLGLREYLARYEDEIYTFCSNDCLLQFLRKPTTYQNLVLPHKLPPIPAPVVVNALPLPGFLEQTVATALQRALSALGQDRPKFPFLKIKRSALIYMGLHLKGYNPRSPECEKQKYQSKLNDFMDACSLPKWLAKTMPLRFQPISERPVKLTDRLDQFLQLQRFVDQSPTWIETPELGSVSKPVLRGIRFSLSNPFGLA
ncbi:hypothetical protein EG68_00023 [Paragonimus skrjabini miyazakii]|uniref:AAA+ ATPase domain-containing protein n=1 Tax=Paragonimus skrjabini miyazakii TaxID=59628 RepID=A0A8S9Z723_9TREM|nr:hypothetical protein EG68_00023 [Paragonimus skrjabini miyazakii]